MWLDVLASPLAQQRSLLALDLRGHGHSPWAGDGSHSMELFADDVAAVIESVGAGPADIVAMSMGGYAALALYERHAGRVRSLTLVDTRPGADNDSGRAGRQAAMEAAVTSGRRALAEAMIERLVPTDADLLVKGRLASMIEGLPVETIIADLRGLRDRADRTWLLPRIAVPTLVVVGERDTLTPPSEARQMASAISGARLVVVPGAGHVVPLEAPDVLVRELGAFWDKQK